MSGDLSEFGFSDGFKPSEVKSNLLLEGLYRVKIVKTEIKTSNKGHKYASFELEIFYPYEFAGRKAWDNLHLANPNDQAKEIAKQRLKQYADACGLAQVKNLGEFLGRDVVATVKVVKDKKTDEQQNSIHKISAFVKGSGTATPPAGSATAGANVDPF